MPFVKLDTGILDSTIWFEKDQRDVFITALLMAEPREFIEPVKQIEVDHIEYTGWEAPPGWYGFCAASGQGIVRRSLTDLGPGMVALKALGSPEAESRSKKWDGRRMIRMDGGYVVLNFMDYRDRDYNAADRMRRLRARKKALQESNGALQSDGVHPNVLDVHPNVTQAEDRVQRTEVRGKGASPGPRVSTPVSDSGSEHALAHWLLEEASIPADNSLRRVVAECIRALAKEGGTTKTAADFILASAREAIADGEVITRFWFTDQKYKPQPDKRSKSAAKRSADRKAFLEGDE